MSLINSKLAPRLLLAGARKWARGRPSAMAGAEADSPVLRWSLDFPSVAHGAKQEAGALVVQGWVLFETAPGVRPEVVVRWSDTFEVCHGLTRLRPDVITSVFGENQAPHPQLRCGFRYTVPLRTAMFELYLRLGGSEWLLTKVVPPALEEQVQPALKVLKGRDGWLFLDNDTNNSVDQFCGRLRLTEKGVALWQEYLRGLGDLATSEGMITGMLVAPSKETVIGPRYHPLVPGKRGPMDQISVLQESALVVHPVPELQAMGDASFHQTDTHWTQKGALAGTRALAQHLGIAPVTFDQCFATDKYRLVKKGGDLGNKLDPPQTCEVEVLKSFHFQKHRVYDNGLPNFGRLIVTRYDDALLDETCVVFGSSSSYSMFNYLARLFRHLVFVHSAGNVDVSFLKSFRPRYLITQTNARFVVVVPSMAYSLDVDIEDKVCRLTDAQLELVGKSRVEPDAQILEQLPLARWHATATGALQKRGLAGSNKDLEI